MTKSYIPDNATFIYHLGGNLTTKDAVNTYGKTGNESNVFVKTTEKNDHIFIGYKLDSHGNIVNSPWDGDFERDHEDGHAVWTMDTAAGDDYVAVRDDQNAYTVAKFGTGNDTYEIGNTLDANFAEAQHNDAARAYVFMEEGDDTVTIKGTIDGGRIFAGEGSDTIIVDGEIDNGGVVDLGAGKTEYANGHIEANSVDTKNDVNTLIVNGDFGESGHNDFAKAFGGAGKDIVIVKNEIQGQSVIDLADNNDEVTVAYMQDDAKILTANDDDTVTVHGSMFNNSLINTAGITREAVEATPDRTELVYDYDQDEWIKTLIPGTPAVAGRSDDDIVKVGVSMLNDSKIDVGDGINHIEIGEDVDDRAVILAGKHKDTLIVHDDLEDFSKVNLGAGNNIIDIKSTIEDYSTLVTGDDADTLTVGYAVTNNSVVELGAGNNTITIGDDLDGNARITTKDGNDTVSIGDDIENTAKLELGEGNNTITVADQIGGRSVVTTGAGNDVLKVGYALTGSAKVDLGAGNNDITLGDDLDGCATISTQGGNDFVKIGDDIENKAKLLLGEGNNIISVADHVGGYSIIETGSGNDILEVGYAIAGATKINLGDGTNTITTGDDLDSFAKVTTGKGTDFVTIGEDIEDYAKLDLGAGNDTLVVKSKVEDLSTVMMGEGNDSVTVGDSVLNGAKIFLGAGDDTISIANGIYNSAIVDGGAGNDTITIGNTDGKHIHSTLDNITNFETIQLVGNTEFEVSLHDLIHDASDNGIFIKGTEQTKVDVVNLHKQTTQHEVNGEVYNVYSNTHHGNEHLVYIQQDVTVI